MASSDIPRGCTRIATPEGTSIIVPTFMIKDQHVIAPEYMVPAIEQDLAAHAIRNSSPEIRKSRGPFPPLPESGVMLAEGSVMVPLNPGHTDVEALALHAEVKALQQRLGLSYKDAAHRLYMAEVERLKAQAATQQTLKVIKEDIRAIAGVTSPPGAEPASAMNISSPANNTDTYD